MLLVVFSFYSIRIFDCTILKLFAAIGGPASMDIGYGSQYDNLSDQQGGGSAYYYPPNPEDFAGTAGQRSTDSIASIEHL